MLLVSFLLSSISLWRIFSTHSSHLLTMMLVAALLTALFALCSAQSDDQFCLAREKYPYLYFGSKTAYDRVYDRKDAPQIIPSCTPIAVWMLARSGTSYPDRKKLLILHEAMERLRDQVWYNHNPLTMEAGNGNGPLTKRRTCQARQLWMLSIPGTRNPDLRLLAKMKGFLPGFRGQILRNHDNAHRGSMCTEDLVALGRWSLNVTDEYAYLLTGQGQADLTFLAKRLKRRFPEVLDVPYTPERFLFRFTNSQRTRESSDAFASGLFNRTNVEMPEPIANDPVLQFYDNCPTWEESVKNNPKAVEEVRKFEEGPEMEQTILRVSRRLGFHHNLSLENVDLMWEMCRYDKAWKYISLSPWCAAFTEEDLKVMEYRSDLEYYYKYSYGNEINVRMGCPPVKDLLDHFTRLENADNVGDSSEPVGVFHFTHEVALHMTLARLGIAKDSTPLLASNFAEQSKRLYRTSMIASFAGNLVAVFYKCNQGEKNRVMFYLREHIVDYEGCEVGLCSWSSIKARLGRTVQDCSLSFCNHSSAAVSVRTCLTAFLAILIPALLARLHL